jgi:hypothetical protein
VIQPVALGNMGQKGARCSAIGLFVLLFLVGTAAAQGQSLTGQQLYALNSVQEEYTKCGVYFRTLITCAAPLMKKQAESKVGPTVRIFDEAAVEIG